MRRRLLALGLLPLVAGIALALPSGGQAGDDATVRVTMGEFTMEPSRSSVPAGPVRFEMRNVGEIDHEMLVVRTDLAPDDIPLGLEGPAVKLAGTVVLGKAHGHGEGHTDGGGALSRHVRPGATLVESVTLTPGKYVLLCSLDGHYQAGQSAAFTVSPGAGAPR